MSRTPSVATIIVHYRCLEDTRRCLLSLREMQWSPHHVIVVDNASNDGSVEELEPGFPEVEWIRSGQNLGYAGGNNIGIRHALDTGADLLQILNPDVEVVNPGYVAAVVDALDRHPTWGAAGPRVHIWSRDRVQKTWHAFPSVHEFLSQRRDERRNAALVEPRGETIVQAVNGVCLFLRAEAIREAGGFDASFFMYGEEIELCYRLRKAGWVCGHVPVDSILHHPADGGRPFDLSHNLSRASQVRFLRRHRGLLPAALLLLLFATSGVLKLVRRHGPGAVHYFRSLRDAFLLRPASPPRARGTQ